MDGLDDLIFDQEKCISRTSKRRETRRLLTASWEGIASCLRSFTWSQHRKIVKFATGHMGVGTKLVYWKFQDHNECPRCDHPKDNKHVLQCTAAQAVTQAKYSISTLETWMRESMDPRIRWTIMDGIKQFLFGQHR